jgi:hypothetical protein
MTSTKQLGQRQNSFRQLCVLWIRKNRSDIVKAIDKELDKTYPRSKRQRRPKMELPDNMPKT